MIDARNRLLLWKKTVMQPQRFRNGIVDRWLVSIQSIMDICRFLVQHTNQQYLTTRQMCNDCCEFSFARMRSVGGERSGVLTGVNVHDAFRTTALTAFTRISKRANVEAQEGSVSNDNFLFQFLVDEKRSSANSRKSEPEKTLPEEDFQRLEAEIAELPTQTLIPFNVDRTRSVQMMLVYRLTGTIIK